jgi:tetratricopeptide (TPR) repeat protein
MLSLAIDYDSAKLSPARYHEVNVLFHLLNTLLVFIFIYRLSGKKIMVAAIVATLFGIHPMHVESVSWISGRKDVLFTFFYVAGLITYLIYLKRNKQKILFYLFTFVLALLSLLCKPAAVTFPLVILLIDFYHKRKFDAKCLLEKIPFLILSIIFGIISIKAQEADAAITAWSTIPIPYRFLFASYSFITYIFKFLFPFNLSAFYPYPVTFPIKTMLPIIFYAAPVIVLGMFFLVYKSYKISRVYIFGFLFYLFNVALILQFVSVGSAIIADRYSYIPYIGLAFIAGMELDRLYKNKKPSLKSLKLITSIALIIIGIVFSVLTFQRTKVWKDNETLWTDVINKFPNRVEMAYKNRGDYYARELKLYDKALLDFNSYIAINPYDATIYSNRGNLYVQMNKFTESITDYSKSISLDSTYIDSYINRCITYMSMNKYDSAFLDINKAIKINPAYISGYQTRACCLENIGRSEEAIKDCDYAISKLPDDFLSYLYRGNALFNIKKYNEAVADFSKAIQLNPENADAYNNRSQTYNMLGDFKNALNDALKAQYMGYEMNQEYINTLKSKIS